ncbi:hypothetical protein RO3G_00455 [Rhizopus delemar RA 99-880]|uniref:Uncharacterized protein n=1 Tax=Rhizopus delemar (strain RA 99-880 / ATCC MYA-4621 / FGSC 9543 / NRRL 43880) TaxID=246409 RepID=I1BHS1_RHIO9|nr:hypothetical protein RO3G_00455 [Rhizopus delemar RA 99-880]|eukprot:EIE75751.1 hypothetical protein RO3G_00455 [Rhizopus delemar RA 99-880]
MYLKLEQRPQRFWVQLHCLGLTWKMLRSILQKTSNIISPVVAMVVYIPLHTLLNSTQLSNFGLLLKIFALFRKISTTPDLNIPIVKQLQAELAAAKAEINRLQQHNASLLELLAQSPSTTVPKRVSTDTVLRPPVSPSSLQLKPPTKRPPPPEPESAPLQKASKSKYAPSLPS